MTSLTVVRYICRRNGYKTSISRIREVAGTDKQGTNVAGVIKAADQLGFNAKGVKGNKRRRKNF